ncbi:MAG: HEAT repeat domain-containing protein, partial [Elusimicrobia bacterium]|nr:HEAT repeat domain-containing protein [Elusimicrobiota bacterium]
PFLKSKDKYMRWLAARALGDIASERGRAPLDELLKTEKNPKVAAAAKGALKDIDDAAFNLKMDMDSLMQELSSGQ